jgi:predicted nucleotidyltransferase
MVMTVNHKSPNASTLRAVVKRILSVIRPEKVILFGSAARGNIGPDSDIDVLVVAKVSSRRRTAQKIYSSLVDVGISVDVVVVTPADVERYRDSVGTILEPALREGKVLFSA